MVESRARQSLTRALATVRRDVRAAEVNSFPFQRGSKVRLSALSSPRPSSRESAIERVCAATAAPSRAALRPRRLRGPLAPSRTPRGPVPQRRRGRVARRSREQLPRSPVPRHAKKSVSVDSSPRFRSSPVENVMSPDSASIKLPRHASVTAIKLPPRAKCGVANSPTTPYFHVSFAGFPCGNAYCLEQALLGD